MVTGFSLCSSAACNVCQASVAHLTRIGYSLTPPAYEPLATLPVRVENGMVQVKDDRWD